MLPFFVSFFYVAEGARLESGGGRAGGRAVRSAVGRAGQGAAEGGKGGRG